MVGFVARSSSLVAVAGSRSLLGWSPPVGPVSGSLVSAGVGGVVGCASGGDLAWRSSVLAPSVVSAAWWRGAGLAFVPSLVARSLFVVRLAWASGGGSLVVSSAPAPAVALAGSLGVAGAVSVAGSARGRGFVALVARRPSRGALALACPVAAGGGFPVWPSSGAAGCGSLGAAWAAAAGGLPVVLFPRGGAGWLPRWGRGWRALSGSWAGGFVLLR